MAYIANPTLTLTKEDIAQLISNQIRQLLPFEYNSLEPDVSTLRSSEGQHGEFLGITIELKPPVKKTT